MPRSKGVRDRRPLGMNQVHLKTHEAALEKLRKDNEALKQELVMEQKHSKMLVNPTLKKDLDGIYKKINFFTRKIQEKRLSIKDKEKNILSLRSKNLQQQQTMGGTEASRSNNEMMTKQIKVLEALLEQSLLKYNANIVRNKKLREQIDHIRRDRAAFDLIYKRIEDEIFSFQTDLVATEKRSQIATKKLDEAKVAMERIRERSEKTMQVFEKDWKLQQDELELKTKKNAMETSLASQRALHAETVADASLAEKGGVRSHGRNRKLLRGEVSEDAKSGHVGGMTREEEQKLKHSIARQRWHIAQQRIKILDHKNNLSNYEEMFQKLEEVTGISNANKLAREFTESESKIYSIFRHIKGLEQNNDELQKKITEQRKEIAKFSSPSAAQASYQKNRLLEQLESKLEATKRKTVQYEEKYQQMTKLLTVVKKDIFRVYQTAINDSVKQSEVEPKLMRSRVRGRDQKDEDEEEEKETNGIDHSKENARSAIGEISVLECLGLIEQRAREMAKRAGVSIASQHVANENIDLSRIARVRKKTINKKLSADPIFGEEYTSDSDIDDGGLQPLDTTRAMKLVSRHFTRNSGYNG
eukprot:g2284.t1